MSALPLMEQVESSNVRTIGWADNILYVEYKSGKTYAYIGVPQKEYEALKSCESIGKFINTVIKPVYSYSVVDNG